MADDGRTLHSWGAYGRTPTARGAQAEGEQELANRGGLELPTDRGGLRVINKIGNCKFDSYFN